MALENTGLITDYIKIAVLGWAEFSGHGELT